MKKRGILVDKFDKDNPSTCPQCGGEATFAYHNICTAIPTPVPHMHRYCQEEIGCGYDWAEEPVA